MNPAVKPLTLSLAIIATAAQRATNLKDPQRRKAPIQHFRGAMDAEIEGIRTLAGIVEQLENP